VNILKNTVFIRKFILILICGCLWVECSSAASVSSQTRSKKKSVKREVTAQAAYAFDYTHRKVLYSRNAHVKFHPASTVKLLTALVVLDHKKRSDRVVVRQQAVHVEPTKAGLHRGVSYSVEDLLKVMLAASANDAAVALAQGVSGSEKAFAVLMNRKAKALGLRDSTFTNPTGLPDERQVTSAYDLALVVRVAMNNAFIASVMRKKSVAISGSDGSRIQKFNHNKLLWRLSYPRVLGKTGYTRAARHCYAGVAFYEDRKVAVVILKSRKPWADIYKILGVPSRRSK
jgi:D-alanyl-D-alanine carboxypeptidase